LTDIAIRVENLSKQYRIGGPQARYKTIRESLTEAVQNQDRETRRWGDKEQEMVLLRTTQVKGEEPMIALRERIVDKLEYLPESNLRQVLSFVEFLTWRATDQDEPLLSVAGVLSGKMLSAEQIEEELYGDRKGV